MQERIEPPILISRLMTFVMATSLVVLVVLIITLGKMFPLNRPQVFFLDTQDLADRELTLTEIPDTNVDGYKKQFIKEYVKARNEIVPNLAIMRAKWANNDNGIIRTRSTDAVFGEFASTDMAALVLRELDETFSIKCTVEFPINKAVVETTYEKGTYLVEFTYDCYYGPLEGQQVRRKYRTFVKLQSTDKNPVRWAERMNNPLGVQVSGYEESNGQSDPLNWVFSLEEQ